MGDLVGAKAKFKSYLKRHFIKFYEDSIDGIDRISMVYEGYERSPDSVIESCFYFHSACMECRVYYDATGTKWCKSSTRISELMSLMNHINACAWFCCSDGMGGRLYKASCLYTPRIYMTEDGCHDITMTVVIPYDFYDIAPLETEDFVTACLPALMDKLSPAIFLLLLGEINLDVAKKIVDDL